MRKECERAASSSRIWCSSFGWNPRRGCCCCCSEAFLDDDDDDNDDDVFAPVGSTMTGATPEPSVGCAARTALSHACTPSSRTATPNDTRNVAKRDATLRRAKRLKSTSTGFIARGCELETAIMNRCGCDRPLALLQFSEKSSRAVAEPLALASLHCWRRSW